MIRVVEVLEATVGGTRKHLRDLLAALPADEFDVHVICSARRDPAFRKDIEAFRAGGCRVHVLKMTRGLHIVWDPVSLLQMRRLLQRVQCDILHLHSSKAGWLGRLAAKNLGCRVIYTPHAFPFLQSVPAPLRKCYEVAERWGARRTDLLLAVGSSEGEVAVRSRLFTSAQVKVLSNAIDVPALEAEIGEISPAGAGTPVRTFGFIGELRRQKDPFTFLEAARELRRELDARYVMPARGGELRAVKRYLRRHSMADIVDLVPVPESLAPVYRRTDIAVLPSRWEGLPYALLEALALRRPVIASDFDALSEVLRPLDAALLFSTGQSEQLAERMGAWARRSEAELTAVGERARQAVIRNHDLSRWGRSLRGIYRSLAADAPSRED